MTMATKQSISLSAGQTLRVSGKEIAAHIARNDDQTIGQIVSMNNGAVFGPYPRAYKFTLTGDADITIDEAAAFEADDITASRSLRQEDINKLLKVNSADAVTLTLPASLAEGFSCAVMQKGAGAVTFEAGSGATMVNVSDGDTITGQYGIAGVNVYENVGGSSAAWVLSGEIA
jgi:hypothetical protein